MSVRKIRNSWWVDFRFMGTRFRKRSPENSKAGAQAFESLMRQKVARGESLDAKPTPPAVATFQAFAQEWLETYAKPNNKPSTYRAKEMILRLHLTPRFGDTSLENIGNQSIEQLKAIELHRGTSTKTLNNILSVLRTMLNCAVEWGQLKQAPRIVWSKVPPQKFDFLSQEEIDSLLVAAKGSHWYPMLLCALRTGMRLGELSGLDWEDVDLNKRMITIRKSYVEGKLVSPKSNRIRHIPIANDLGVVLAGLRKSGGLVFLRSSGAPVSTAHAWTQLRIVCKRAGLRKIGWHTLRHTFASHLVMKGVPIRAVQMLMGHSTIQMTERYSHLSPSSLSDAIAMLESPKYHALENFGQQVGNTGQPMSLELEKVYVA
jgi:integrase